MSARGVILVTIACLWAGSLPSAPAAEPDETEGVSIPESEPEWRCPVEVAAKVTQGNGGALSHNTPDLFFAFDYGVRIGTPIVASRSGVVASSSMLSNIGGPDRAFIQDGNEIEIRHSDGTSATYEHLAKNRSLVRVGEFVLQGERIGYSGDTGWSTGPHLHFNGGKLSFADFRVKGGVPGEGDSHGPPAKPAVPQATIEAYKSVYRACLYAERVGLPEVGLHLLQGLPSGGGLPGYFYSQVLEKKRERYAREMASRADAAGGDPLTLAAIRRVAGKVPSLKPLAERIQPPKGAPGVFEVDRLLEAWRLEALGDAPQAGGIYAALAGSTSPAVKAAARDGIRRLIANYLEDYQAQMDRLEYESDACLAVHVPVVKKDLDELAVKLIALAKTWKLLLPEEAEKAQAALSKAEEQYTSATKELQERK